MRRTIVTGLLALALLAPAAARAAYDPIGSGRATIALDHRFASFLAQEKIELTAKAGARRQGGRLLLPVNGGNVDPTLGAGEIGAAGALIFAGRRGTVPLREIRARIKRDTLIAKVGGSQLKLASSAKRATERQGFGTTYTARQLKLTAKVATRLNKKLRPKAPFYAGQLMGNLTATAQPALATIEEKGRASISLDPAFAAKLDSLFVSVNPIFPAEHPGAFTFPIAVGGQLAPDGTQGVLRSAGALEFLQLGAGQVFQNELWLEMGTRTESAEVEVLPTPAFPGKLGRVGAYELGAAAQVSSDPKTRTITVSGPLALTAATAATFDEAFAGGKGAFAAGESLGTLSFTAHAQ